ncbi:MAG: RIO1 family regulatory kinase/ATPase [Candidatus Woesearchaeota archaeon]
MAQDKPIDKERFKAYGNVFTEPVLRKIFKLSSQGHFDALESPISIGKEANIFSAKKGDERVIVKIYRVENCNFNKMREYLIGDYRYSRISSSRRQVVYTWAEREFRNLMKAREAIPVPMPRAHVENIIVMEFIGKERAAPQLKDADVKDWKKMAKTVFSYVKKLKEQNLVHGDLSEFNILVHQGTPIVIDFSQCTPFDSPLGKELLERDIQNLLRFFKRRVDITESEARKIVGK